MAKIDSILKNGCIPAHTDCPFKKTCKTATVGQCNHFGKDHPKPFSCGLARLLEVIAR